MIDWKYFWLGFGVGTIFFLGLLFSSYANAEEKYIPMCIESPRLTHCHTAPDNIGYLGSGRGTLNNISQTVYSFGYLRRIETFGGDNLYVGLELQGSDKNSLYGTQLKLGYGW